MPDETSSSTWPHGPLTALQLDGAHARFLHQPGGVAQRLHRPFLVRAERQIADDERALGAPDDRRGQQGDLVHGDRHGGFVAEVAVAHRVADEQDGDPGLVEDGGGHRVVGGEHRPLLAALLGGGDIAHGDPARTRSSVERLVDLLGRRKLRHGDGSCSSSRAP